MLLNMSKFPKAFEVSYDTPDGGWDSLAFLYYIASSQSMLDVDSTSETSCGCFPNSLSNYVSDCILCL